MREEFVPLERAMVYVPGGTAAYPSSLIMGVVPARLAGVKEIFVTTPTAGGKINPYISAAATLLGIKNIYRLGGAQAIYAFAYGIGPIPKVDIIVGPGNAYVEEAKRDVYGSVGIDMLAGPTELIILCTEAVFSESAFLGHVFSGRTRRNGNGWPLFTIKRPPERDRRLDETVNFSKREKGHVVEKALANNGFSCPL